MKPTPVLPDPSLLTTSCFLLPLTQGQFAILDTDGFYDIECFRWCAQKTNGKWRAMRRDSENRIVYMHRQIMGLDYGDTRLIDHRNGNSLDNRRKNLRIATKAQNAWNTGKRSDNTSGFRGVAWDHVKGKWQANITVNGTHYFLGHYDDPREASSAYEQAALFYRGDFAKGYRE